MTNIIHHCFVPEIYIYYVLGRLIFCTLTLNTISKIISRMLCWLLSFKLLSIILFFCRGRFFIGKISVIWEGPSKPSPLVVQFTSEGSTLSGCDIELVGAGYRFSLIKKRFAAGKWVSCVLICKQQYCLSYSSLRKYVMIWCLPPLLLHSQPPCPTAIQAN